MTRKFLALALGITTMLTSCQKEDVQVAMEPLSNQVSVGIELPSDISQLRALPTSPDGHSIRCVMAVYDEAGTQVVSNYAVTASSDGFNFSFELETPGDYTALLWADYTNSGSIADKYYTTTDLKSVTMTDKAATTPECKEAFYAVVPFTKQSIALDFDATLARAVAKVTIAETNQDNYNEVQTFSANYNIPTTFNLLTSTVSGSQAVSLNNITPSNSLVTNSTGTSLPILFYDYLLADADGTMDEIMMSFNPKEINIVISDITIPAGVPVKRNQRTVAAGSIVQLTDISSAAVNLDVTVDDTWGDEVDDDIEVSEISILSVADFFEGGRYETCCDLSANKITNKAVPTGNVWVFPEELTGSFYTGVSPYYYGFIYLATKEPLTLEFPNTKLFPSIAFWAGGYLNVTTVKAPMVTIVKQTAFKGLTSDKGVDHIYLPKATEISADAFKWNASISYTLTLGTEAEITSMDKNAFGESSSGMPANPTTVDLITGKMNEAKVYGSTLTVGGNSFIFKSITIQ